MSPTLVSNCMEFNEKFPHGDIAMQNMAFDQHRYLEAVATQLQEASVLENPDSPVLSSYFAANVISRPPVSRRHSSSNFNFTTAKAHPLLNYMQTSIYSTLPGSTLETLPEERFRNRAYSEGSALHSDPLHEHQQQPQPQSGTSRYKTELCRPFEESGKCKYGDKCQFAHGKHELRQMVRHPKYKTELCRTYHSSGLCPYGPRCHFIHNQDDVAAVGVQQSTSVAPSVQRPVTVAVTVANHTQRLSSSGSRPSNLQLVTQRGSNRAMSYSYSPTFANSPSIDPGMPFVGVDTGLRSPISPLGKSSGQMFFNYGKAPMSPLDLGRTAGPVSIPDRRQASPPFDFNQRSDLLGDDTVFDSLTPPDSDRESANGSPPGLGGPPTSVANNQRLPIFRCLSQSSD